MRWRGGPGGGSAPARPRGGAPFSPRHGVVVVIPWLTDGSAVSWGELGGLLRRFHAEHAAAPMPSWTPLSRLTSQVQDVPAEAAEVLLEARALLLDRLGRTPSVLGVGTIHGDVSPSNVMRTVSGPRLIDTDWVAAAPREYDLASASRRFRDGSLAAADYAAFCDGYGHDVLDWPGLPVLDRIADLGGVAFRIWDDRHHGRPLTWLAGEAAGWREYVGR